MKYKIILAFFVVACYLGNTSCKKFLDIKPEFKFVDSAALNSVSGLYTTTIGAFSGIKSGNLYSGGIIANSELLADFLNVNSIADFSLNELRIHQMESQNAEANGMWNDGYSAILKANVVLANLSRFPGATTDTVKFYQAIDTLNLIKGECLFIRATMHFELVRMYAQPAGFTADNSHMGIPIEITPGNLTANQSVPRSTVAQVYKQIIADLTTADSLLSAVNNFSRIYKFKGAAVPAPTLQIFAAQYAAQGFLVRAYFEQNNFALAKQWADSVISTSGLSIDASLSAVDSLTGYTPTPGANEVVFQCLSAPPNDQINGHGAVLSSRFHDISAGSIIPLYVASPYFYNSYLIPAGKETDSTSSGDLRVKTFFKKNAYGIYTACKKYDDYSMNVPIMRLEEVYLDRAECNNRLSNDGAARNDLNLIRQHAGLKADNSSVGGGLLSEFQTQRDIELAMEGDRLFEIKRRQQNMVVGYDSTITIPWNSNQLIYPIPLQEVSKNPQMVQNPGY